MAVASTLLRALLVGSVLYVGQKVWRNRRRKRLYPPGPKGRPVIGSKIPISLSHVKEDLTQTWLSDLPDIPRTKPCLTYAKWGQQYGVLTYLNAAGKTLLVLNTFESMKDLLEKRSHVYSDRPRFVMTGELMGKQFLQISSQSLI